MSKEEELLRRYPAIEWTKPIPLTVLGGVSGFGCRFCIAMYGYKQAKNQMPGFSEKEGEVLLHIGLAHITQIPPP